MKIKRLFDKKLILGGALTGLINGLLGAGGGMIAVPVLEGSGADAKQAHSGSIAVMLPLSLFSAAAVLLMDLVYAMIDLHGGRVTLSDALPYIPAGIACAFCGVWLMNRISPALLHKIFGVFAIWAGVRMLMR